MRSHASPTQNLSAYHQNNGLLFQFMMEEFLAVLPEVEAIRLASVRLEGVLVKRRSQQEVERLIRQILSSVAALTGSALVSNQVYPWTPSKGSLGKLKHYILLFTPPSAEVDELCEELKGTISVAYHSAMQARDVLWQLGQRAIALPEASQLFRLLNRLGESVQRMGEQLPSLLAQFRDDENVVYFLLRRSREFDKLHQRPYVRSLFSSMFEGGIDGAQAFLRERYLARGFKRLVERIDERIADLRESVSD